MQKRWSILLPLLTASSLCAQKYAVHLSQLAHAGETYSVSTTGSMLQQGSVDGKVVGSREYQVSFEGQAEILEVDARGEKVGIAFTVRKFTKSEGGSTIDLLKAGSIIIADGDKPDPISLKDGTMDSTMREAFRLVSAPHKSRQPTDDEIFGTKEERSIGDSWSINAARASDNLKESGIVIPVQRLSGTVSLISTDKIGAIDCLNLRAEMKGDSFAMKESAPGITMDRGSLQIAFRGCLPMDGAGLAYSEGSDLTIQVRLTSKDGVSLDTKTQLKQDAVWVASGK